MLGDKSRTAKEVFYRSSLRVPVIVRPPNGHAKPVVSNALVSIADLTATVLDMAGCNDSSPNRFGKSLLPAFTSPDAVGSDVVISEIYERDAYGNLTMIFDGRWKMVVSKDDLLALFDTLEDPAESLNLAGHPKVGELVGRLRDRLLTYLLRTADCQYGKA
jgi:arylsulfatase A-like enzyme